MRQVRFGVFETNSSSTHCLVICTQEEYHQFQKNELMYDSYDQRFLRGCGGAVHIYQPSGGVNRETAIRLSRSESVWSVKFRPLQPQTKCSAAGRVECAENSN